MDHSTKLWMDGSTVSYLAVKQLRVIRISCRHADCRMAFELAPDRVEAAMKKTNGCCPLCGKPFTSPTVEGGANVIVNLARAVVALEDLVDNVWVELPVEVVRPQAE